MKINGTDSMSRQRHRLFAALFLITACVMTFANAQETNNGKPAQPGTPAFAPKVINIWPGVAPGSEHLAADSELFPVEDLANVKPLSPLTPPKLLKTKPAVKTENCRLTPASSYPESTQSKTATP